MKKILLLIVSTLILMAQAPSQNRALNAVSPSGTHSNGSMQNAFDDWLKDDWKPTQKKIQEKENKKENNSSSFKLQDYVDKWEKYNKEKALEPKKASHKEMLDTLPAIGR